MDARIGEWYARYGALVFRRALQILGSRAAAEEATQEVFIRAARSIGRYDGRARPTTWLYRITTNLCLNQIRDAGRRRELLEERGQETVPGSVACDPDKLVAMRALLAKADPRQAEAALAVYVDGMSHNEAAKVLGVSRRTVGNLCDRFVAWARAEME